MSEEELKNDLIYYKWVDEFDIKIDQTKGIEGKGYLMCGENNRNRSNLTAWKYMIKILGLKNEKE